MKLSRNHNTKKWFYKRVLGSFSSQMIMLLCILAILLISGWGIDSFWLKVTGEIEDPFGHPLLWGLVHFLDGGFAGETIKKLPGSPLWIMAVPCIFAFLGIFLVSLLTGACADFLAKRRELAAKGLIPYSFAGNHVVVIGWDFQCKELLGKLHEENPKSEIVIMTQHDSDEIKGELNSLMSYNTVSEIMKKVFVIHADYTSEENYQRLNIASANSIFIIGDEHLSGRDTLNLSVLDIVSNILKQSGTDHKRCYLHIADTLLFEKLKKENLLPVEQKYADLRVVNFYDSWAWRCWCDLRQTTDYLPLRFRNNKEGKTHLFIAGFGSMGKALALMGIRLMNYGNSFKGCKLTIVDPDKNCRTDFENMFNGLEFPELEINFIESEIQALSVQKMIAGNAVQNDCSVTIVLAIPNIDTCLKTYYALSPDIKRERVSIMLWLAGGVNAGHLPESGMLKGNLHYADVRLFGMRNKIPWYDNQDLRKNIAQDVNDAYCELQNVKDRQTREQKRKEEWDKLTENLKWSNYSAGDSFKEKIYAAGLKLIPSKENGTAIAEEDWLIAEHNRWLSDRLLLGWHYTERVRNDEVLNHPDMIPYSMLPVGEQEKDAAVFTALNTALDRAGFMAIGTEAESHHVLSCIGSRRILRAEPGDGGEWKYKKWSKQSTLDRICNELKKLQEQHPDLIMYNSLAIGADELFWLAARKVGIPVIGILPLPAEKYAEDFAEGQERSDFYWRLRGCESYVVVPESPRPACYTAAAEYMLEHSSALWAITDGSQGKTGGTFETLQKSGVYENLRGNVYVLEEKTLNLMPFAEWSHTHAG